LGARPCGYDRWPGAFNHVDHRVTGIGLIDAARDAGSVRCGVAHAVTFELLNL